MTNSSGRYAIERLESRRLLSLGAIDTSFSGDGTASYEYRGEQYFFNAGSFAVARDGSVIVAGTTKGRDEKSQILLARISADGKLDRDFGEDGYAITKLSGPQTSLEMVAVANEVRLQQDGKILVAGALGDAWAVFRFNRDGSLDRSFDQDGIATLQENSRGAVVDLELLKDGTILVGGTAKLQDYPSTHANDFGVARIMADGTIDRTFGNSGFALSDLGRVDDLREIAVDRAGNIVVAGESDLNDSGSIRIVVLRYRPDGALDTSFGKKGRVVTPIERGVVLSLRTLHNGRILLSGASGNGFLMRLDSRGRLDRGFGRRGIVNVDLGSVDDRVNVIRADRRGIVAVGTFGSDVYPTPEGHGQYLLNFRPDGSTDSSTARSRLEPGTDAAQWLTGGANIVGGEGVLALFSTSTYWAGELTLARFRPSGAVDATFGDAGKLTMNVQGPLNGTPYQVITQADGKSIVLAGLSTFGAGSEVLLRMDSSGGLDSSFGKAGRVDLEDGRFNLLAMDSQGRIMLAGGGDFYGELVKRLHADGSVDSSFGEQGLAKIAEMSSSSQIVVLPDGKILVVGYRNEAVGVINIKITRLNANGSVDERFGEKGTLTDSFDGENGVSKLLVGADGKLTVVGTADRYHDLAAADPIRVFIGRYNADGSVDRSFSRVLIDDTKYTYDSRLTSDGGVLLLAHGQNEREFKVMRYKANGAAQSTKILHTAADIKQAFFDSDGSILVLTAGATLHLAADGTTMASGAAVGNLTYSLGKYEAGTAVTTITRDHKLMVSSRDADGDLMLSRYLLG